MVEIDFLLIDQTTHLCSSSFDVAKYIDNENMLQL